MARTASHCALALFFGALACGGPLLGVLACGGPHWRTSVADGVSSQASDTRAPAPPPAAKRSTEPAAVVSQPVMLQPKPRATPPRHPTPSATADSVERDYPLHGLAFHALAQVFSEPSERAAVIGYFRRGGRLRAKPALHGNGCDTRWHAVLGGGFICAGRGFLLAKSPPVFSPLPAPPSLHDALPYAYAKTTIADTPLYLRIPTRDEEHNLTTLLAQAKQRSRVALVNRSRELHRLAKQLETKRETADRPQPTAALPDFVRMLMRPGYYVSVDGREPGEGSPLLRTVRGDLLPAQSEPFVRASQLHGTLVDAASTAQLALVYRAGAPSFTRDAMSGALQRAEALPLLQPLYVTDEIIRDRQHEYRITQDGRVVPADALRFVPQPARPPFVPAGARYIAIQLSTQTLVAYDGNTPVYATLVSTGKTDHETPTGIFRIQHKHVSITMDGEVGSDDAYSIEDVPWTMYFSGSLALHAAFWHERFGRPRSHGCVNLAPLDARWLFEWAGPTLPLGFHGVVATRDNPGTFVVITP
jgi:lipoprotein-anchoring transpeptidase ErfK/SrfK